MRALARVVPPRGPERTLAAATLVNTLGNGLLLPAEAIFLTRSAGLPLHQVGIGLTRAVRDTESHRWVALRDTPFLTVTALNAIVSIQYRVLTLGIPLWVVTATEAPRWLAAGLMLVNTVAVVLLQVRASRGIEHAAGATAAMRRAGLVFLVGWVVLALAGGAPAGLAVGLLVLGVAVHTLGELWHAAASFELGFSLARPDAQGQYQGVFQMSMGISDAVGAGVVTVLCIDWGKPGWLVLGAVVALAGALCGPAARWALARRRAA